MLKYWFRNRFILSVFFAVVFGIFTTVVFIIPNLETHTNNLVLTSVYDKSNIDFDIPAPTKDQLNNIKNLEFIDDVFGYYYTESYLKCDNKDIKTKILFSDCLDSLEMSMYNKKRIVF